MKKGELSLIDQLRGLPKGATIESVRAIVEMEQNELVLKKHAFSPDATAAEIIEILGEGNPALNYVRSDFSGAVELGKRFPGIYALALSGGHRTFFDKDESADAEKLAELFPDGITMQEALNNPKLMYKGVPLSRIILEEMMAENFLLGGGHRLSEHAINNLSLIHI